MMLNDVMLRRFASTDVTLGAECERDGQTEMKESKK